MEILRKYFEKYSIIRHQLDTFNDFVLFGIQNVINDEHNIYLPNDSEIKFSNVRWKMPTITPAEARENSLTYDFTVQVDIEYRKPGKVEKYSIDLCNIPAMVRSVTCNLYKKAPEERIALKEIAGDHGGYFVINGKERIIAGQTRKTYNRIICYKNLNEELFCETRSSCEETAKSSLIQLKFNKKKYMDIIIDKVTYDISEIISSLGISDHLEELIGTDFTALEECIYFLRKPLQQIVVDTADSSSSFDCTQFLPHLGTTQDSLYTKGIFLCKMIRKLILTQEQILQADDKSNLAYKRVDMVGILCQDLFKMLWKQFIKSITKEIKKRQYGGILPIINIKKKNIGLNFLCCFSSGIWGITKNNYKKMGVSEFAQNKVSSLTNLALLKKFNIPVGKKDKNIQIRQIHPSSIFFACPSETPEGPSVGTRLSLTITSFVSQSMQVVLLKEILVKYTEMCTDKISLNEENILILVNGTIFATISSQEKVLKKFLSDFEFLRVNQIIRYDVSILYNPYLSMIEIWCDASRFLRPILKTELLPLYTEGMSATEMEQKGILVYRDPMELENAYISMDLGNPDPSSDYTEIHPCCMMGIVAAQIPFTNHTQSPRICYMANMVKQAMGSLPTLENRTDAAIYNLDCVQAPLNRPEISEVLLLNENPNGINAIVAIACYTGFNQEDSIIINKAAIDRGLFRAMVKKTISMEIKTSSSFEEIICVPEQKYRLNLDYSKLDPETGVVKVGAVVNKGDVIIGKILITKNGSVSKVEDKSIIAKTNEEGKVDSVMINTSVVKVIITQVKVPEIGDKFCSGMAQKGTCGMILSEIDMPFTKDGMIPDIIINPHCIPSRMTINQLMSCVCSKAYCISGKGKFRDGSAFGDSMALLEAAAETLEENGFSGNGTEIMYNGMTGEKIFSKIFMGPVYYHRLTHLVSSKIFSSTHTTIKNKLTRQPLNGRSNEGGLRIGEMEKDCLLRHGIIQFTKERMLDLSDKYVMKICNTCKGYYHVTRIHSGTYICNKCKSKDISTVSVPYAFKLLFQELESMGLKVTLTTQ